MNTERLRSTGGARTAHRSSLDIQALRATLAEIDFAFESDLEVVKNSAMDEGLKRKVIATLQQRHRERRAAYVHQLAALRQRTDALAAWCLSDSLAPPMKFGLGPSRTWVRWGGPLAGTGGNKPKFSSMSMSGGRLVTTRESVIKPTVLLVQSEPAARTDVAVSLIRTGFNVIEAESTGEAWTTLEAQPDVRVLLTDLDVSNGADGLEFARKVYDRWPSIGLVITSGQVRHLRPDDVPGGGCFLPRPVPAETLLHEVKVAAHQIAA
jgi:two-component system, response regulator PdtaR